MFEEKKNSIHIGISPGLHVGTSYNTVQCNARCITYSLKSAVIVAECISDHNETNKRNSCLNLILFTNGFLDLCSHGVKGGTKCPPPSISPKLKMIYQWNFPHRSMYPLYPLFACFPVWLVSSQVTVTLFLWPPPANYVNSACNRTCLRKIICNCLHWCNLCSLSQ